MNGHDDDSAADTEFSDVGHIAITIDEVAERHANARVGFRLVDYDYVGLPLYRLDVEASFLTTKTIPPVDEFILCSIGGGLQTVEDISAFLGLDERIVKRSMVALTRTEDIVLQAPPGEIRQTLTLTQRGRAVADEAERILPVDHRVSFFYDGLLKKPVLAGPEPPMHPRELRDAGIREIPSMPAKPPALEDLIPKEVYSTIRAARSGNPRWHELLAIKAIQRRQRFYLRAVGLVYRSIQGNEVQVSFAIDGRLSPEHERAFSIKRGPEKTGILQSVLAMPPDNPPVTFLGAKTVSAAIPLAQSELLQAKVTAAKAQLAEVERHAALAGSTREHEKVDARRQSAQSEMQSAMDALNAPGVRLIGVTEHPKLLATALTQSERRLLIISPWIRAAVVDELFIRRLDERLRRGVKVYIGYGLGTEQDEERRKADEVSERELQRLAAQHKDRFDLQRFGDTHAKILICDDRFCIATSFNWLSFRGDSRRTFREELGYLVTRPTEIEESFRQLLKRFKQAAGSA